jgi:hypothetical protein
VPEDKTGLQQQFIVFAIMKDFLCCLRAQIKHFWKYISELNRRAAILEKYLATIAITDPQLSIYIQC